MWDRSPPWESVTLLLVLLTFPLMSTRSVFSAVPSFIRAIWTGGVQRGNGATNSISTALGLFILFLFHSHKQSESKGYFRRLMIIYLHHFCSVSRIGMTADDCIIVRGGRSSTLGMKVGRYSSMEHFPSLQFSFFQPPPSFHRLPSNAVVIL